MSWMVFILFLLLIALLISLSLLISSFILTTLWGAPYVGSPKGIAREMLVFAELKPGETMMDLGSGTGTILMIAAKEFKAKRALGYEIHPFLVWWTRLRALINRISSQVKVNQESFFKAKLPAADVVTLYLWPSTMTKLAKILKESLPAETRIVSRGFTFKNVTPIKTSVGTKSRIHLYRVGDLK